MNLVGKKYMLGVNNPSSAIIGIGKIIEIVSTRNICDCIEVMKISVVGESEYLESCITDNTSLESNMTYNGLYSFDLLDQTYEDFLKSYDLIEIDKESLNNYLLDISEQISDLKFMEDTVKFHLGNIS